MKFITWNVNGLRACMGKGFLEFVQLESPDFICLQETKMQEGQAEVKLEGYRQFWNSAQKKGYSGTAIFAKEAPLSVSYDIGAEGHDMEGRSITLEYPEFYLITEYTPNAQDKLARIDYRLEWEAARRNYLKELDQKKPIILCGDLNVAHQEIDLKNPKSNRGNAGFSDEERDAFEQLLGIGLVDSYRYLYPDTTGQYTWWSYRFNARANNAGWRIDYFLLSERMKDRIQEVQLRNDIFGSDHCPVVLELK
ncbi:exodeoxyribonuclease III [Clostridium aminobutyricum]|uniref:Exodeoxyribonuclease III n=1 Tax=Clostridium aminobutyricum TaxID=33953 RepID=A0A939IIZ5_CLOAM|nr:exodeoxyribonuclease III [Clostridium aminobutyricum]MBN7773039.1 exodeoxyribonuclease III [Clostridium aminobutyricum]